MRSESIDARLPFDGDAESEALASARETEYVESSPSGGSSEGEESAALAGLQTHD